MWRYNFPRQWQRQLISSADPLLKKAGTKTVIYTIDLCNRLNGDDFNIIIWTSKLKQRDRYSDKIFRRTSSRNQSAGFNLNDHVLKNAKRKKNTSPTGFLRQDNRLLVSRPPPLNKSISNGLFVCISASKQPREQKPGFLQTGGGGKEGDDHRKW